MRFVGSSQSKLGAVGALVLAVLYQRLSWKMLQETSTETIKVTAMVFAILVGATAFSMVFT
jgi:TRAP-type mannitol/chloroaromatic compound transport system permease large subunit